MEDQIREILETPGISAEVRERLLEQLKAVMGPQPAWAAADIGLGASLDAITPFTQELEGIVHTMQGSMATETKILEGDLVPTYGSGSWEPIPVAKPMTEAEFRAMLSSREEEYKAKEKKADEERKIQEAERLATIKAWEEDQLANPTPQQREYIAVATELRSAAAELRKRWAEENELSNPTQRQQEWSSHSRSGCSTTGPTPTSTPASNTLSSTAGVSTPSLATQPCGTWCSNLPTACSKETSGDCGCETGASNASCDSTVQTINVPMAGTPSEAT
jgi:hypothetical protein